MTNIIPMQNRRDAETLRKNKNRLLSARDQVLIAENVFRLLAAYEEYDGFTRLGLCMAYFKTGREDSTKRLRNFTLDPNKQGDSRERACKDLHKGANGYIKLCEKAAELAGQGKDDAVLRVFHGAEYGTVTAATKINPFEADLQASFLRSLERACERIVEDTELRRVFRLLSRYRMKGPDVVGAVRTTPIVINDGEPIGPEQFEMLAFAPQVCLGLVQLSPEPAEVWHREGRKIHKCLDRVASCRLGVRVWLAIIPYGSEHLPRPAVLLRLESGFTRIKDVPTDEKALADLILTTAGLPEAYEKTGFIIFPNEDTVEEARSLFGTLVNTHRGREAVRAIALASPDAKSCLDFEDASLNDCDWVGPDPDEIIESMDDDYENMWDDGYISANTRFIGDDVKETVCYGWPEESIGWKLERSELECPPGERPTDRLAEKAQALRAKVDAAVQRALGERERRLHRE